VPVLLHYAENDRLFGPETSKYWHQRFVDGGGHAEYVLQPPHGRNGHYLFTQLVGVEQWLPAVERFLDSNDIPFERLDEYEPGATKLLAAELPERIRDQPGGYCKAIYRLFLESPGPRAYAVSEDGHCGFAGGMPDARERALGGCERVADGRCELYAVDEKVVWGADAPATLSAGLPVRASD